MISATDDTHFEWILWYYGKESVSPLSILPSGAANKGFIIPVTIKIKGRNREKVKRDLTVQVGVLTKFSLERVFKSILYIYKYFEIERKSSSTKYLKFITCYLFDQSID